MSANDPAFPGNEDWMHSGLTKREYFAGQAIAGKAESCLVQQGNGFYAVDESRAIETAKAAAALASALIKALGESHV